MTGDQARQRVIASMCPTRVCRVCGEPSRRIVEVLGYVDNAGRSARMDMNQPRVAAGVRQFEGQGDNTGHRIAETVGFSDCGHDDWRPGKWFDPFQNQEGVMLTLGNIDEKRNG